jgi:glutamate-1-semialdehyde 2,1-aminomutase
MRTVAIVQARMGSTRLPGKVLQLLAGLPVLAWTVRAARAVPGIDHVLVATTDQHEDDELAAWCSLQAVDCVRGEALDVLARFNVALDRYPNYDAVMRLTADCPFLDPHVCGEVLGLFEREKCDYASNVHPPTWPDGLDCEVISVAALRAAHKECTRNSEREHVTPFVSADARRFKASTLICPIPNVAQQRWTLDNAADLEFLQQVARGLPSVYRSPAYTEVLRIVDADPALLRTDSQADRDESFLLDRAAEAAPPHKGYKTSQELLSKALQTIPLGSQTFSKSHIQYPKESAPLFASYGRGGRIWDVDGNEYVDLVCGLLSVNLGYADPDVDRAIRGQLTRGITFSLNSELESRLAELVISMVPSAEMVRFAKNGTDVTSAAVRLARGVTGREHVIFCGYHGWQDWYVGATSMHKGVPNAVRGLTHHVPYNDLDALEKKFNAHPGEVACVVLEPLSGNGPIGSYLKDLCDLTRERGALVVFDEVISGFRIAAGGAQEYFGITPDLTALGKGIANGMPLSALAGKAEIMNAISSVFFSGTFGGETLSLSAGVAVLEKIQREPVIERLWQTGSRIAQIVERLIHEFGLQDVVSLKGLAPWKCVAFRPQLVADGDELYSFFVREMARNGVLTQGSHNICFAHSADEIAWVEAAYQKTLCSMKEHLDVGTLRQQIEKQVVRPLFRLREG